MLDVRGLRVPGSPPAGGLSFTAAPGETVALVGPPGSGKTQLLRAIAGLTPAQAGSVTWCGGRLEGPAGSGVIRRGVAFVPASRAVLGGLSVRDNLRLGGLRLGRRAWRRELDWVTGVFPGLSGRLGEPAASLDAAEQRVVALGRALLARPRLLLVDGVSVGGVPVSVGRQILDLLAALAASGLAVVVAERRAGSVPGADRTVELPAPPGLRPAPVSVEMGSVEVGSAEMGSAEMGSADEDAFEIDLADALDLERLEDYSWDDAPAPPAPGEGGDFGRPGRPPGEGGGW